MARNVYKGGATSIAFNTGGSRYRELDELRSKQKDETDAIKLAQYQAEKRSSAQISGIKGNQQLSTKALLEGQKIEGEVRDHKFAALSKFAETDVAKEQGKADAMLKYADYLKDLAPKAAAAAGKLAEGGLMFADKLVGIQQWNSDEVQGKLKRGADGFIEQHWKVQKGINKDATTLTETGDIDGATSLLENVKVSSYWAQRKILKHITDNQAGYQNEIIEHYNNTYGIGPQEKPWEKRYGEKNAVEVMDFGARNLLAQLGIPERSAVGREIINKFRTWGSLDANGFYEDRKVEDTKILLENLNKTFVVAKTKEEKEEVWNSIILARKNGWYKDQNGTITNPNKTAMAWSDSIIESAKELITANYGQPGWDSLEAINAKFPFLSHETSKEKTRVPIQKKFEARWRDEVVSHIIKEGEKYEKEKDNKNKADGLLQIPKFKRLKEELDNDESLSKVQKELKRLDNISAISKLKIPEKHKVELYSIWDYNFVENESDASRYVLFNTAVLNGNEVEYMKILNSTELTDSVKTEMLRRVGVLKTMKEQSGLATVADVLKNNSTRFDTTTKKKFQGKELKRSDNLSSINAETFFQARIQERVNGGETYSSALEAETELLRKGVNGESNIYEVKKSPLTKTQTFINFESVDSLNANKVGDYFNAAEKTEEAWNEIKKLDVITIQPEQLAALSTTVKGEIYLSNLLNNPEYAVRLIPPENLDKIKNILIDRALEQKSGLTKISSTDLQKNKRFRENQEKLTNLIPQVVKDIAKTSGLSNVQAMNMILRANFGSVIKKDGDKVKPWPVLTIGANSQDVSILLNEGKYVAPRDEDGYNFFNSMKANTGFVPMRPETRMCTYEDRSVFEAFMSTHNTLISQGWSIEQDGEKITIDDSNRYKLGSKWDSNKGGFVIHDVKAFAQAGGISQLIKAGYSEDVLKLFGIPTFTNTIKGK